MQSGCLDKKLCGDVEVDESYIGGKARNMHFAKREEKITGRGGVGKAIVMGLLERGGRVTAKVVTDTTKEAMHAEVKAHVETGANLHTDTHPSYEGLSAEYIHEAVNHAAGEYVRDNVHTNTLENFWSLLKRLLKGTYVSCEPFHLFRYLDEQSFRYNERKDNDAGRFVKVVSSIANRRLTYRALIGDPK